MPSSLFTSTTQYACVRRLLRHRWSWICWRCSSSRIRRVTECRFHRVLLLLLGNDLLQGKIGVDLVCVLQSTQLQKQGLIDALKFGHDGLLGWVLGLGRSLQIGDVRLSCGLIGADRPERLQVVGHHGIVDVNGGSLCGNL